MNRTVSSTPVDAGTTRPAAEVPARPPRPALGPRPSAAVLGLRRGRLELKMYFRSKEAVVFNFAFPIMLLMLFGSIFGGEIPGTGVDYKQVLVAGVMAASLMSVSFASLATGIAIERDDGTLKLLALSPVAPASYFIGKVVLVFVCAASVNALALGIGVLFYGLALPADPARWLVFFGVFTLGVAACSLLGITYSRLARSARTAAAVVTPPFIALQFISGVWLPFEKLPVALQWLASLFPLRWIVQGMRYVFLPDRFLAAEPTGSWQLPAVFGILAGWVLLGAVLSHLTFQWNNRSDR